MFSEILQKFAETSPATVMVRALLERLLNPEKLDRWFEATRQTQYTRDMLFSSLVGLMLQVVCKTQASVHAAYRQANIAAVYAKLQGVELTTSQALVTDIAREARDLILAMQGARPSLLPGYRLKYLDGNCLAASEHRLKPLRATAAGPLPGKSLVVFDPQLEMAIEVFPCADGHTQERALLAEVIPPSPRRMSGWLIGIFASRPFCSGSIVSRPASLFVSTAISSPSPWKNTDLSGPRRAAMSMTRPCN